MKKYNIDFGRPLIGVEEREAVAKVLEGPILVHGPKATEFETAFASYVSAPFCVSVSSCTAGMHLIYEALGIGKGDTVLVPAQTHVATAHAVELAGAKAEFVDCYIQSGNINVELVEQAISPSTKAIAVVHYLGVPANLVEIKRIADRHNLYLIEDCALAIGAKVGSEHVGLIGDAGAFSFYPVKHITTAEGGVVITKNEELDSKIRLLKAFGVDKTHSARNIPGMYDTLALGYNYRMSEIHAAIGVEQVKKIPFILEQREANFKTLSQELSSIEGIQVLPQPVDEEIVSSHYCLGLLLGQETLEKRPQIMNSLVSQGVGCSVYYPQPVPRMSYYKEKYGYKSERYQSAEQISDSIIALPVGPHLNKTNMLEIKEALVVALGGVSG